MKETEHPLALPAKLIDIDVDAAGNFAAVLGDETNRCLSFNGINIQLPEFVHFPKVRVVSEDCAIVIDARSAEKRKASAWLIEESGRVVSSFFAGDGIQDILVCREKIVVTYFDEGVFSGIRPSEQGLVVFDFAGNLVLEYQKAFGAEAVDIVDCYCACTADSQRVFFSAYTEFPLVELNIKHRKQHVHPIPDELRGASALSVRENRAYFYSPYKYKGEFFVLDTLRNTVERCGKYSRGLRGLRDGSFLAYGDCSYTIISPENQQ